jgi:CheY-like chemotaxis protein
VPGNYIMLSVSDTGIGMTEEVRKRLFEPFFTTKLHNQGTGLGLATVYGVVKQSGGYITVESEPHQGATFRIYFPCISITREPTIVQIFEKTRDNTETILVVEDEIDVLNLIVYTLNSQGFTVLQSNNPTEAVSVFTQNSDTIDLLLSDVVMPFLSGPKLAVKLRELKPDLKVLFMSGHADKSLGVDSLLGDGVSFIPKPFMQGALLGKIRSVLDGTCEAPASDA